MSLDRVSRGPIRRPLLDVAQAGGWVHVTTEGREGWCHVYFARLLRWSMHEADSRHRSDLLVRGTLAFGCWAHVENEHATTRPWTWFGGKARHDFFMDRWVLSEGCRCIVVTECRGSEAKALRTAVRKLWAAWGLDTAPAPIPGALRTPPASWTHPEPADRPPCPVIVPPEPVAELTYAPASGVASGAASVTVSAPETGSEQKRTKANSRDDAPGGVHPPERRSA